MTITITATLRPFGKNFVEVSAHPLPSSETRTPLAGSAKLVGLAAEVFGKLGSTCTSSRALRGKRLPRTSVVDSAKALP